MTSRESIDAADEVPGASHEVSAEHSGAGATEVPDQPSSDDVERKLLSTFKFSKPPAEMTEEEIDAVADRILDQWTKDLTEKPAPDADDDA